MNIRAIQTAAQKPNKDWKREPTEIIIWIEAGGKTAPPIKPLNTDYADFGQVHGQPASQVNSPLG